MTHLSEDNCQDLGRIMTLKYAAFLGDRSFTIMSKADRSTAEVTVTALNPENTFVYPIEARIDLTKCSLNAKDACLLMLDYIDSYFEEFFREEENVFVPIDWTSYSFEGSSFELKGQIRNVKVEELADKLLSDAGENFTPTGSAILDKSKAVDTSATT